LTTAALSALAEAPHRVFQVQHNTGGGQRGNTHASRKEGCPRRACAKQLRLGDAWPASRAVFTMSIPITTAGTVHESTRFLSVMGVPLVVAGNGPVRMEAQKLASFRRREFPYQNVRDAAVHWQSLPVLNAPSGPIRRAPTEPTSSGVQRAPTRTIRSFADTPSARTGQFVFRESRTMMPGLIVLKFRAPRLAPPD